MAPTAHLDNIPQKTLGHFLCRYSVCYRRDIRDSIISGLACRFRHFILMTMLQLYKRSQHFVSITISVLYYPAVLSVSGICPGQTNGDSPSKADAVQNQLDTLNKQKILSAL